MIHNHLNNNQPSTQSEQEFQEIANYYDSLMNGENISISFSELKEKMLLFEEKNPQRTVEINIYLANLYSTYKLSNERAIGILEDTIHEAQNETDLYFIYTNLINLYEKEGNAQATDDYIYKLLKLEDVQLELENWENVQEYYRRKLSK